MQCASDNLWGVTMLGSEEGITVNVGSVNPMTGQYKDHATSVRYLGGAAAYDACSAMDKKNQVNQHLKQMNIVF